MRKRMFLFLITCITCNYYTKAQIVSTIAGTGTYTTTDGAGITAGFASPVGICSDTSGSFYVAETSTIRKISSSYFVTTLAGSGTTGNANGTGTLASFYNPFGVCVDPIGNIYVADTYNHNIRKITSTGLVTTFAGTGSPGNTDGTGSGASFNGPVGICSDVAGNIYVADTYNHKIRKITPLGVVSSLAGSGSIGSADGLGSSSSFNYPYGICMDPNGVLFVTEIVGNRIRQIYGASVTTFAGSGLAGSNDASGISASFDHPAGICSDPNGNIYVADQANNKIRKITSAGIVTTFAGSGIAGSTDATGAAASFNSPQGICSDVSGNIYVADQANNKIRKITPSLILAFNNYLFDDASLLIYPNPSNGLLFIETKDLSPNAFFIIEDLTGRVVLRQLITANKEQLNLSFLDGGIYYIYLSNNKINTVKKIIKE